MRLNFAGGGISLIVATTLAVSTSAAQVRPIHLDPSRPLEARVDYLVSQLSLEEKVSLLGTTAPAIERLNIPEMWGWNQSLHGVVWSHPTTMFPVNIGMAATWNPELIQQVASIIHDEARAINNLLRTTPGTYVEGQGRQCCLVTPDGRQLRLNGLVFRSPVINISRQPLWGRIHEAYGEDPHLTSRMAVAYVRGMQGDNPTYLKTAGTLKHYAMNNEEGSGGRPSRHYLDAQVPERWIHEYYLPHFRAGIVEGGAKSIMSIYNKLNGVPGAANSWLMIEMLREAWGFDGFGVPDSNAIPRLVDTHAVVETYEEAAARAIRSGHDLDEGANFPRYLDRAVELGYVTEADIDQSLRRVLRVRFQLGEFDPPELVPYQNISPTIIRSAPHRELALRTARESIVLLSNGRGLLPLDRSDIETIAVIGPHADSAAMGIGYTGQAADFVKPIDGIVNKVVPGTEVLYAKGTGTSPSDTDAAGIAEAAEIAARADVAVLFVGTGREYEREGLDRTFLNLPSHQQQLVQRVMAANPNTVVVMITAGPMSLTGGPQGVDVPTVVNMFMAGEEGGNAVAEVLFGDYNPGGKLPYTVYVSADDVPGWDEYDVTEGYTYMWFRGEPEWPFGHGLSYTTFDYSNLAVSSNQLAGDGQVTVTVDVRNSGGRAGDEVVQLYVRDLEPAVERPIKQLRAFERIHLAPGQRRSVSLTVSAEGLAYYDVDRGAFVVRPGPFEVLVGSSSADIRETSRIEVTSAGQWAR